MEPRFYRQWVKTDDLIKSHLTIEETDLCILSSRILDLKSVEQTIYRLRTDITDYTAKDKRFADSLKPIAVELESAAIIKLMANAANIANVGPMAAVAGSIAQLLAEDLLNKGYEQIIVENGGDIFLSKQKRIRHIAIFAGESKFSEKLLLRILPEQTPCGICTSSATVGHSLSFGSADSLVILAKDASLADAVATAACNLVKSKDDFNRAIDFARNIPDVLGVMIILGDDLATWGQIEIEK